jgi:UDP-GlcNAc3NAcA epimerase
MKAAAFSHAIEANRAHVQQILLHTGQHYSHNMSGRFQEELQLPKIDVQLDVVADPSMRMGQMMKGVSEAIAAVEPDAVVVFGDTDSTLAAALAASRAHVPVVHIEAGLRSFDRRMPEEHNRILTDQLSDVLFCPSESAVEQLAHEGIAAGIRPSLHVEAVGDLMLDTARFFGGIPKEKEFGKPQTVLLTLHRPSNVDDREALIQWIEGIARNARALSLKVLFPVHPRTQKGLVAEWGDAWKKELLNRNIEPHEPASYLQILEWLNQVDEVWTDSGGLQKEAFFMKRPALVLRDSTEWKELVAGGFAVLCAEPSMLEEAHKALTKSIQNVDFNVPIYGDGHSANRMINSLIRWLSH